MQLKSVWSPAIKITTRICLQRSFLPAALLTLLCRRALSPSPNSRRVQTSALSPVLQPDPREAPLRGSPLWNAAHTPRTPHRPSSPPRLTTRTPALSTAHCAACHLRADGSKSKLGVSQPHPRPFLPRRPHTRECAQAQRAGTRDGRRAAARRAPPRTPARPGRHISTSGHLCPACEPSPPPPPPLSAGQTRTVVVTLPTPLPGWSPSGPLRQCPPSADPMTPFRSLLKGHLITPPSPDLSICAISQ